MKASPSAHRLRSSPGPKPPRSKPRAPDRFAEVSPSRGRPDGAAAPPTPQLTRFPGSLTTAANGAGKAPRLRALVPETTLILVY
jgi:hypothetical protein